MLFLFYVNMMYVYIYYSLMYVLCVYRKLEVLERAQWPVCGLNLANTIIKVLENVSSDFLAGERLGRGYR